MAFYGGLVAQVIRGRWLMVHACILIMSAAGATYIFGVYSNDIKTSLGYDQQTLNTLSFFKDVGANVGVLSGLINEVTPPWVVLTLGAAMNLAGYLMIYLAIAGKIPRPAVWQMCLYICIGANSQTFANTGALVTCVKNFPESRGVVLGLLKGFVGLSGAIITQLYLAFYGDNTKSLVLFIGWLPAAISLVSINTIRIMSPVAKKTGELKAFYNLLYIALALAGYLMVMIVVEKKVEFSKAEYDTVAVITIVLLFLPLLVVVWEEVNIWKENERSSKGPISISVERTPTQVAEEKKAADYVDPEGKKQEEVEKTLWGTLSNTFRAPARGEDYSILQALVSVDMIVLFVASICGVGGTLTAIDNMGQIGISLGYPSRSISTFVSLISIWNCLGRFFSGFLSEALLTRFKFPRPLMLTATLLLSCAGHLLIAFGVPGSLYVSSVIIGFCFGAQWPLLFAIISEIFGLKYYSTLYNFGGVASPIGSYILNVIVAGRLYDGEAARQRAASGVSAGKDITCVGVECYRLAFLIITGATLFGAVISLVLVWRTRSFYKGDIYKKFREASESVNGVSVSSANGGEIEEEEEEEVGTNTANGGAAQFSR